MANALFTVQGTPIYRTLDDLTVAGVVHTAQFSRYDRRKRKQFLHEATRAKLVGFEGKKQDTDFDVSEGRDNLETVAYKLKPSSSVFLEEELVFTEVGRDYGLNANLVVFYFAVDSMGIARSRGGYINVERHLAGRASNPRYRGFDSDRLAAALGSPSVLALVDLDVAGEFHMYFSRVRDQETIVPAARQLMEMNGRKLIVAGAYHADNIINGLRGKDIRPMPWQDYVERLAPRIRDSIKAAEAALS